MKDSICRRKALISWREGSGLGINCGNESPQATLKKRARLAGTRTADQAVLCYGPLLTVTILLYQERP